MQEKLQDDYALNKFSADYYLRCLTFLREFVFRLFIMCCRTKFHFNGLFHPPKHNTVLTVLLYDMKWLCY